MNKKYSKRVFCTVIALLLCVVFILPVNAVTTAENDTANLWQSKIDAELWAEMADKGDDDLFSVYVWLSDAEVDAAIAASLRAQGMDPMVYSSTARFDAEIMPEVIDKLYADGVLNENTNAEEYETIVNNARYEVLKAYSNTRLETVREEYTKYNTEFVEKYINTEERDILYFSNYTSTLIVEATKGEIELYAKDDTVNGISLYVEVIAKPDEPVWGDEVPGDVNFDGEADNVDAALILKYDAGMAELDASQLSGGDVNCDGAVDNIDATLILKYCAGIIDVL